MYDNTNVAITHTCEYKEKLQTSEISSACV